MTNEILPLSALQTSLLEIASVAYLEGGKPQELCSDLWGTRLYNRSKLWGLLHRLVRCIVYALLRKQTYELQFNETVKKTHEALLHHLQKGETALAEYHVGLADLKPKCSDTLVSFYRYFYSIATLLEDNNISTKVDGLFQSLFKVKVEDIKNRLRAFQDQQACLRFNLLTDQEIPWEAFKSIANKGTKETYCITNPTLQAWFRAIATDLITRKPSDRYVWELAQTLPAIWRSLQKAFGSDGLIIDYSVWIVFLKNNGMQDRFPPSTPEERSGTIQSETISQYHVERFRRQYNRHLPAREVVWVSETGRSVTLKDLSALPSLPKLFKELASYPCTYVRSLEDRDLYPGDFGVDKTGKIRSFKPLVDTDFDMELFDAWVWKAAGEDEEKYRAIYLQEGMKETVVCYLFYDFRIASATTSRLGLSRSYDLLRFTISQYNSLEYQQYQARFDTVFQRMQKEYTALAAQVTDLPNWNKNSAAFWKAYAWELFPGLRLPRDAKERYRAKYSSIYSSR
jgi:hypothetical protein